MPNDKKVKGEWIKIKEYRIQIVGLDCRFENDNVSLFFNFYGVTKWSSR